MSRPQQQTIAALTASIQRGMLAGILFTTIMGAGLFAALVATEAPKHPQFAQEQAR